MIEMREDWPAVQRIDHAATARVIK